jgi:hypothetical protein
MITDERKTDLFRRDVKVNKLNSGTQLALALCADIEKYSQVYTNSGDDRYHRHIHLLFHFFFL